MALTLSVSPTIKHLTTLGPSGLFPKPADDNSILFTTPAEKRVI